MPKETIGFYAVHKGYTLGVYKTWNECKEQIQRYPGALYKKFYTKQQAEEYINEENEKEEGKLKVWTDGYCENNGKSNAIASIGVFFGDKDIQNLSERLLGLLQTNN